MKISKKEQVIKFFVLFLIFVTGLTVYKDYGLTLDDEYYRINGFFYKDYITKYFSNLLTFQQIPYELLATDIGNNQLSNHPALFEIILSMIADFFKINNIKNIYELSHLLNFLIYFSSLIVLMKIVNNRFNSTYLSILAVIVIFTTPRFFAEAFYNSRDIFFFSLFIFFLYAAQRLILNDNIKNLILFSFTSALIISAKLLGIIPFLIFTIMYTVYIFENNKKISINFKKLFLLIFFSFFFLIVCWPYLWLDPFNNLFIVFVETIKLHESVEVLTYFNGKYLISNNTPWYYRIVWFLITTPLIISLLYFFGLMMILKKFFHKILNINNNNLKIWDSKNKFFDFFLLFVIFSVLFVTNSFNVSKFGGWRHLYFLYAPIVLIFLYAYKRILNFNKIKILINSLILSTFLYNTIWIIKNHPFQNVYFNSISTNYAQKKFDLDYWGVTNFAALKYILTKDNAKLISVASVSFADLNTSKLKLDILEKKRLNIIDLNSNPEYLIDNHMRRIGRNYKIDKDKYKMVFNILVDKNSINTIYRKIK